MVLGVQNLLILDFVMESKPKACSLAPTKKMGMGASNWGQDKLKINEIKDKSIYTHTHTHTKEQLMQINTKIVYQ